MSYPTPGEYQEALQLPASAFEDEELQQATPEQNVLGLPQAITGAFAVVFPMETRTGRRAVKCFLSEVSDQRTRYRAIAQHLEEQTLPALIDFDYQPKGIHVDGQALPLLKMEWVRGVPLNRFVEKHRHEPEVLDALATQWIELLAALEAAGIAHGDLQHGNVLVVTDDDTLALRLVDYDTMYVPALKGRSSPEVGHRNYQHPDRSREDFGPYLDRFSGLVIYTALQACRHQPGLWARYDTGENLLFRAADFYDPSASVLFEELARMEAIAPLVDVLRQACYLEPEVVPPLPDVLDGAALPVAAQRSRNRQHRPAHRRTAPRTEGERYFVPAVLLGLVVVLGLAAYGEGLLALGMGIGGAAAAGGWAWRRYRRLAPVRRRRRLQQEAAYFDRMIASIQRQIETLQRERREVIDSAEDLRAKRLRELQAEALYDRLKYHFINEARAVEGITHKIVVRLKAAGIRTAYQATDEELAQVRELGEESRARLVMWRAALVRQYEADIPDQLSPAQERRLARYVEHRISDLDAEMERAHEKVRVQEAERDQVHQRAEQVPDLSFARYLCYLLRLRDLPEEAAGLPAPSVERKEPAPTAVSQPAEGEQPWWRRDYH